MSSFPATAYQWSRIVPNQCYNQKHPLSIPSCPVVGGRAGFFPLETMGFELIIPRSTELEETRPLGPRGTGSADGLMVQMGHCL